MCNRKALIFTGMTLACLAGCATQPTVATIPIMPAPNKPFEVFMADQAVCQNYAGQQVAGGVRDANNRAVGSAALTTGLGALIGAGVEEWTWGGAGIGAATGLVVGSAVGAFTSNSAQHGLQSGFDMAYAQCMYAKGNQVPGYNYAPYQ